MSARYPVMVELYELFAQDTAVGGLRANPNALVTGVFDAVPEDAAQPYIQLGEATETPQHTFTSEVYDVVASLRIWSTYDGFLPAARILERMTHLIENDAAGKAALRDGLAARGWTLVRADYQQSDSLREPEQPQRSVPVRIRVLVSRPR